MATSKPYRYLAIDLKPDTPNDKRLWPNVFEQTSKAPTAEPPYYSEQKTSPEEQTVVDPSSDPNFRKPGHCQSYPLTDLKTYKRGTPPLPFQFSKEPINVEDMASIMARASCDEWVCYLKLYLTCKIMSEIGVMDSLTERDPG